MGSAFGGTRSVASVLISDAEDLCTRENLAGHSAVQIRKWEGGTVEADIATFDGECATIVLESAHQGWLEIDSSDPYRASLDLVFRTKGRNVSGSIQADYCPIPLEDIRCDRTR
jgi:hypothetical protein